MSQKRAVKIVIAVVVIGAAAGYLLYEASKSCWVYYYSVDEFVESGFRSRLQNVNDHLAETGNSGTVRIAGRVRDGSIVTEGLQADFELSGSNDSVPVRYYGVLPKNFTANKEVVVEGKVGSGGVFSAEKILTRCESKYRVRLDTNSDSR